MDTLFQNILTASFHGSIVILAVLLLRLALKKAPKKFICLLWLLAGIRLLMPFEIQSSLSLQPEPAPIAQVQSQAKERLFPDTAFPAVEVIPFEEEPPAPVFQTQEPTRNTPASAPVQPATVVPEQKSVDYPALIPYLWLIVALGFGVVSVISYLRLKRQVRFAIKIPGGWESERIDTAFILGFIRPKIYIPMGMSESNRTYILAHERTHLEKGDHWFKMIGYAALAIHWFNPLVWLAYILLCKDIEIACDERVVQFMELEERKAYSAALLSCSSNRAHFAACPVAFGEVSVKERIKSVLYYRKPGFWVSLLGVAAVFFVAVCLLTSPAEDTPAAEPGLTAESTPAEAGSFTATLTEDDVIRVCQEAIEELKARESYCVESFFLCESDSEYYGSYTYSSFIRRHGENLLSEDSEAEQFLSGELRYNGNYAAFYGDKWAWEGSIGENSLDVNYWLDTYTPQYKVCSQPQILSGDTVSFQAEWSERDYFAYHYSGTFTFTFNDDGTLASASREYIYHVSEEEGGGQARYVQTCTVMDESSEDTIAQIEAVAAEALTRDELDEYRLMQEIVTEVPSNKTNYDMDFMLGSGQMGWKFMKGEWFFKFGAVDVTDTSARILVEYSGAYGDGTIIDGTVKSGPEYFIEEFIDGVWTTVEPTAASFSPIPEVTLDTGGSQTIRWENNYGALPAGFYRIGNYYTFTGANGETDTQVCYAKFRLYDPSHEALLSKAKAAIEALKTRDSYHLYAFDWLLQQDFEYYLSSEVWKHGADYLEVTRYPLREDITQMTSIRGSMWRGGNYYGLTWADEPVVTEITDWWQGVDGYMDDSNFSMWSWDYEWFDANVELVYQEGNTIHILESNSFSDQYVCTEIVLTLDESGNLAGLAKYYLPTRNAAQKDKLVAQEMVIFDSSSAEIRKTIDSQDLTQPMPFSYAEDVNAHPEAQTSGFKNTNLSPISSPADAVALANKECTMPQIMNFDNGYLQTKVYRDSEAGIWKVELFWWQHDTAQTVYLSDDGITQMIVAVE